jgi:hypothetical protein
MESFISHVISQLQNVNLDHCRFILPSRRAAQAFSKELLQKNQGQSFVVPPVQSIEEFLEDVSEVKLINNLETLFEFYNIYKDFTDPNHQEPIDHVYNWGQSIIQDFNEIDRYQIDADQFFGNIKAIKDIEHWSKSDVKTELVENYIKFWESLPKYYHELKANLKSKNKAYQGMAYLEAVKNIEAYSKNSSRNFYLLGFNALNRCEEVIFQTIINQNKGKVFWDIDNYLYDNHIAGMFLRHYSKTWPCYSIENLMPSTSTYLNKKGINIYGVPKKVGQAKLVGDLLSKMSEGELDETALILGDETLLQPILNSLPNNIKKVNVTMGLPLHQTNMVSFFEVLFKIRAQNEDRLHFKTLLELSGHPVLKKAYQKELQSIETRIHKNNIIFQSKEDFLKSCQSFDTDLILIFKLSILINNCSVDEFLTNCTKIIEILKPNFSSDVLQLEYLFGFKKLFTKLKNLMESSELVKEFKVFHLIYTDILSSETLDFEGSPYDGLQIMGMLESRVLDFKNVIITSLNEGVLPSGKSQNSFIPFDLKKAYKLPTYKEKDAIYAYHFFRLIQRSSHCHFIYNNATSGIEKAEKSRFLTQLEIFKAPQHSVKNHTAISDTQQKKTILREVRKTPQMIEKLESLFQYGISTSALTTYIRNPIDFYHGYVLDIKEADHIEDDISFKTHGTVIHDCLDFLYRNYKGKPLDSSDIDQMLKEYPKVIKALFEKRFPKETLQNGKNLIDFKIAKQQIKRFLVQEKESVKSNQVVILELENTVEKLIAIDGIDFLIKLKGTVDRIDLCNKQVRIIDYKTGRVESKDLKIPENWTDFIDDYKYSKAFQVLFYSLLKEEDLGENGMAGIISLRNLKSGFMTCSQTKTDLNLKALLPDFKIQLKSLILEILDPEITFKEKLV